MHFKYKPKEIAAEFTSFQKQICKVRNSEILYSDANDMQARNDTTPVYYINGTFEPSDHNAGTPLVGLT